MIFNKIKNSRLIFILLAVIFILIFHQIFREEEVFYTELLEKQNIFYKKGSSNPFTGSVTGKKTGKLKNGMWVGHYSEFDDKGVLQAEKNFISGSLDGISKTYFENGKIYELGSYVKGIRQGKWKLYYRNGNLRSQGMFEDGYRSGIWTYYNENESLFMRGPHVKNLKSGLWETFHKDGSIKGKGEFKSGLKQGNWTMYEINGKLDQDLSGTYDKGVKINTVKP